MQGGGQWKRIQAIRKRMATAYVLCGLLAIVMSMIAATVITSPGLGVLFVTAVCLFIAFGGIWAAYDAARHIEEEVATCERQAETSASNLHNFMMRIAHTLRTPLNEIRWSTEMLKNEEAGRLTTAQRELLDTLEHAAVDVLNRTAVLQDTLGVLKGEKLRVKLAVCEILPLIDESLGRWAVQARRKKILLVWNRPPTLSPFVRCDAHRIHQVLDALLANAILYTKSGKKVVVSLDVDQDQKKMVILVKDQGIGIPEPEQAAMFTPFYRASNASDLWVDGSGISLTLSQAIVREFGGVMTFESRQGKGTTMRVELPTVIASKANGIVTSSVAFSQ